MARALLQRRQYEFIAATLRTLWLKSDLLDRELLNGVVENVADALVSTNPRFDRERFLRAVRRV